MLMVSKREMRKMRREAGREEYLERRREKRKIKRERDKIKRAQAHSEGTPLPSRSRAPKNTDKVNWHPMRICIEMGFDQKMHDGEIASLAKQLAHCYAVQRRMLQPVHLALVGYDQVESCRMHETLQKLNYQSWKGIELHRESLTELYDPAHIVYLTADSPNILGSLEDDTVYVLGGLVDKNRYKGLCLDRAVEMGVRHAQLPISEYIQLNSRKILTVNQVFAIMMKYLECQNWQQSFLHVIPSRKVEST
jgi:tRNA (guanine9-N1)-methyltransferase